MPFTFLSTDIEGSTRPNSLPAQATTLVGRDELVREIRTLLCRPDVRLVTLRGPGGIGKTRVALQVGAEIADEHEHGVWLVQLAPLGDARLVLSTIAATLGVKPESLAFALRDRQLVLLLDNFEHVQAAAPDVASLLSAAPRLKVLATSRSLLKVYGEQGVTVPPLAVPSDGERLDLARHHAVRLFVERAAAMGPGFAIGPQNAADVAAICAHLDGLPLSGASFADQQIVKDYTAALGWTQIVPMNVDNDFPTDLLSYDATTGHAIVSVGEHCEILN